VTITADIEDLAAADFMMVLAQNLKTGQLTIENGDDRLKLAFRKGNIVYAASTGVRETVGAMLVRRERLSESTREVLLTWRHSGFEANAATGAAQGDREALHRLACYLDKSPLALGRMQYPPGASQVLYHGKNPAMPGRGTLACDPVAFLALVLLHVADRYEVRLRYYGAASSTIRRGGRRGRRVTSTVLCQQEEGRDFLHLILVSEDREEDAVDARPVAEGSHGASPSSQLSEATLDGVGGSHSLPPFGALEGEECEQLGQVLP